MNIVFWLLLIIGVVFLWFLMPFMFKPIGKFFGGLYDDAKKEMSIEKTKNNENMEDNKNE